MPKENQTDPTKKFVPRFLPWLLGLAMLVVYFATLNHWVTLANLMPVAKASGFVWQPDFYNPLLFLATLPFHWLPAAKIPRGRWNLKLRATRCTPLASSAEASVSPCSPW